MVMEIEKDDTNKEIGRRAFEVSTFVVVGQVYPLKRYMPNKKTTQVEARKEKYVRWNFERVMSKTDPAAALIKEAIREEPSLFQLTQVQMSIGACSWDWPQIAISK